MKGVVIGAPVGMGLGAAAGAVICAILGVPFPPFWAAEPFCVKAGAAAGGIVGAGSGAVIGANAKP